MHAYLAASVDLRWPIVFEPSEVLVRSSSSTEPRSLACRVSTRTSPRDVRQIHVSSVAPQNAKATSAMLQLWRDVVEPQLITLGLS